MATKAEQIRNLVKAFGGNPRNSTIEDAIEDLLNNLPFGTKTEMVEIVPEQSVTSNGIGGGMHYSSVKGNQFLEVGKEYSVIINGKKTKVTAIDDDDDIIAYGEDFDIGNDSGTEAVDGQLFVDWAESYGETITLAIYEEQEVVTTLPAEFLPEHSHELPEHTHRWEQLEDKPFSKETKEVVVLDETRGTNEKKGTIARVYLDDSFECELVAGGKYIVNINDKSYEVTANVVGECVYLGNYNIYVMGTSTFSELSFVYGKFSDGSVDRWQFRINQSFIPTLDGDSLGNYKVSIIHIDETITPLPAEFLPEIELPEYLWIDIPNGAHQYDTSITEAYFPIAKNINSGAFARCSNLTTVIAPNVTSIKGSAFNLCSNLTEADFPNVTNIGNNAFGNCSKLETVNFPKLTSLENGFEFQSTLLRTVRFPLVTNIGNGTFSMCYQLQTADFPSVISINKNAFGSCPNLKALILRSGTVCELLSTDAFKTPSAIASGTGYIYVPSALVDTYKSTSNWSTYADQFRALEDYTVDGTITGELDESKI